MSPLPGVWTGYIDATTTGRLVRVPVPRSQVRCVIPARSLCTWDQLQELINPIGDVQAPVLLTVGVGFQRQVDVSGTVRLTTLRIGGTVYDFEEYGVVATTGRHPLPDRSTL